VLQGRQGETEFGRRRGHVRPGRRRRHQGLVLDVLRGRLFHIGFRVLLNVLVVA
jgi:hypothetical protein